MLNDLSSVWGVGSGTAQNIEATSIFRKNPAYSVKGFEYNTYEPGLVKDCTLYELLDIIDSMLPGNNKVTLSSSMWMIYTNNCAIIADLHAYMADVRISRTCNLTFIGEREIVQEKQTWFKDRYSPSIDIYVNWMYMLQNGSLETQSFLVEKPESFDPSYYPYISDVEDYMLKYHFSKSNILILMGPPGTGKSSFLKKFLHTTKSSAYTTYDQNVMQTDSLYVSFLKSSYKYLILEDSDILLLSREKDDNRVMSKILNASDGLISTSKKFIFTANITNESQIDDALTRPGRCFDIKHFRHLTRQEAGVVAEILDKDLPEKDEYSLAEIFNDKMTKKVKDRVGFI